MGLIQNMQQQNAPAEQQPQQGGEQEAMHKGLMDMLGAALLGDGGQAVAGRLQAGGDKIQGVAESVAGGVFAILKQAKEQGRQVPANQIVKAVYVGCKELLATGNITDPDSKVDALFRAMDKLKEMDASDDVIDDQVLADAGAILSQLAQKLDESEPADNPQEESQEVAA